MHSQSIVSILARQGALQHTKTMEEQRILIFFSASGFTEVNIHKNILQALKAYDPTHSKDIVIIGGSNQSKEISKKEELALQNLLNKEWSGRFLRMDRYGDTDYEITEHLGRKVSFGFTTFEEAQEKNLDNQLLLEQAKKIGKIKAIIEAEEAMVGLSYDHICKVNRIEWQILTSSVMGYSIFTKEFLQLFDLKEIFESISNCVIAFRLYENTQDPSNWHTGHLFTNKFPKAINLKDSLFLGQSPSKFKQFLLEGFSSLEKEECRKENYFDIFLHGSEHLTLRVYFEPGNWQIEKHEPINTTNTNPYFRTAYKRLSKKK